MHKLAILLALAGVTLPAVAARLATVTELEQVLNRDKGDAEVAQLLSDLELTERLSASSLERLKTGLPGDKSREQLTILADRSEFLDLPAAEIPAKPAPDQAGQRRLMTSVVNYVTKTIHELPNFLATRETRGFADRPQGLFGYLPLHAVGETSASVVYQDGKEVDTAAKNGGKPASAVQGLTSWGEFGPILSTVLLDAAQSTLEWSHWEGTDGELAVFRYAVPQNKSHYHVQVCCVVDDLGYLRHGHAFPKDTHLYNQLAGYHGEIAVDPATGTILRITVIADFAPNEALMNASIMVEYGAREIGGRSYVLPLRSVAVAQRHAAEDEAAVVGSVAAGSAIYNAPVVTQMNDVAFEQYHLFRADARVLTPAEAVGANQSANTGEASGTAAATAPEAAEPAPATDDIPAPASPIPASAREAPSEAAPSQPAQLETAAPRAETPVFKTIAREVVLDVVITKGNGDSVTGLSKQDFVLMENGKTQSVDFLEEHTMNTAPGTTPAVMPPLPDGALTNLPPAPEGDSVNVLLIDTLNTEQQDRAYVQKQVTGFLKKMKPGTRLAIFLLGSKLRLVQGFTGDASALLASMSDKQNGTQKNGLSSSDARDDQTDIAILQAMRASSYGTEALQKAQGDAQARDYAARASMTFEALNAIAHYLAGVKGRKNLIWFAGSFPVVIFPSAEQRSSIEKNPNPLLPGYLNKVKQTGDLFTDSQISLYPISAQGMMSERAADADLAGPGSTLGPGHFGNAPDSPVGNGATTPYLAGATERANTMSAMEQLAASTGGKAFFNTNDLHAAIERAIEDGASYYTIGYSPTDKAMDGSFRRIEVKVDRGKFRLAYRQGYNADGPRAIDEKSSTNPLVPLLALGMPAASGVLYGVRAAEEIPQSGAAPNRMGESTALKGPLTRYRVDFVIRAQDLRLEQREDGERIGSILLGLKGYDRDGNAVNWQGDQENLEVKPGQWDELLKTGVDAHLEIDLPRGVDGRIVTAVYDLNSGNAGSLEVPIGGAWGSRASQAK